MCVCGGGGEHLFFWVKLEVEFFEGILFGGRFWLTRGGATGGKRFDHLILERIKDEQQK